MERKKKHIHWQLSIAFSGDASIVYGVINGMKQVKLCEFMLI